MKCNLQTTIDLYATAAGNQSTGSSLTYPPHLITDTPAVRDIARHRLVKTNPDVDAQEQTDSASFVGKENIVQDTKYGHYISEHDATSSAKQAMFSRPYSRVIKRPEVSQTQKSRDAARKKIINENPDIQAGGPGSGRHKLLPSGKTIANNKIFLNVTKVPRPDEVDGFDPVKGKLTIVNPKSLIPDNEFQTTLYSDVVNKYIKDPNYHNPENAFDTTKETERYDRARVINYKGKLYIMDGHHRVAAALIRGDKGIKVLLLKVK